MALPQFTIRELLEAGVHFGHRARRWNPQMQQFIYGTRNDIHVIDLQQTVPLMYKSLAFLRGVAANGGRVLFVGSKHQAADIVRESAKSCGQYYVNHRWLGGMMTNWKTIHNSIKRLKELEVILANPEESRKTKKELLQMEREYTKLERSLGGIKDMGGLPDALFIIDTNRENIAVAEANKLGIPVVAVLDTNSNPAGVDYPIPGNDDSARALRLYFSLITDAIMDGTAQAASSGRGQTQATNKTTTKSSDSGDRKTVVNLSPKAAAAAEAKAAEKAEKEGVTTTEEKAEAAPSEKKAEDGQTSAAANS